MAGLNNRVKITNDIELKDRLVAINRVTKVTKGGRTFSFSAIVVVGNEEGIIGWGLGKAGEVTAAIAKGVESAKKNLTRVPVLKGTVPHEQSAKFGGAEVFIKPASHGTGVVAGGAMRAVLDPRQHRGPSYLSLLFHHAAKSDYYTNSAIRVIPT